MGTLIYRPGQADEQRWELDLQDPEFEIGYTVETVTEWPWQVFLGHLGARSHKALQALIYAHLKRDDSRVRIESVRPRYRDFDYEADVKNEPASGEPEPKGKKKKAGDQGEA